MNKKDLITSLSEKTQLAPCDVKKVIEAFFVTVVDLIAAEERVRIKGFGVFYPIYQTTRPVRNPRTGEALELTPRNNFKFKPGDDVLRKLNRGEESSGVEV